MNYVLNEHVDPSCFHRSGHSFPTRYNRVFLPRRKWKSRIRGCWRWRTIATSLILSCRGRQFTKLATHCELMPSSCFFFFFFFLLFTFTIVELFTHTHPPKQIFQCQKSSWPFFFFFLHGEKIIFCLWPYINNYSFT